MRQKGLSLEAIGWLQLLALPIALNFLWSPFIDRYGFTPWGHYRFWIICFQLLIACMTAICGWLSVEQNLPALLICITLISLFCASLDVATDALAIGLLKPSERGLGNTVQSVGGSVGAAIGGGGMLILFDHWGWAASLQALALIMVVALLPVLMHQEKLPNTEQVADGQSGSLSISSTSTTKTAASFAIQPRFSVSYFQTFINFCRHPGMPIWLLFLLLYSASTHMAATMYRPLLVDIGLSLSDIGSLLGLVGTVASALGGIAAGFLIPSWGRKRSLFVFSILWALTTATYLLPTFGLTSLPILYLVAISTFFAIGIMNTATFTIMMDKSNLETPGTDYTIQSSVGILGSLGAASSGGVIAEAIGYRGVFAISLAITIVNVLMITKVVNSTDPRDVQRLK
jgi:MFS family permease